MLFPEIKTYFIENEIEENANDEYVTDIERCRSIEELIQIVSDYKNQDEFESAYIILNAVCK